MCVFRKRKRVRRPFENDRTQFLAKRIVDLVKHRPRRRKGLGERLAHTDRLTALAGKYECNGHFGSFWPIEPEKHRVSGPVKLARPQ